MQTSVVNKNIYCFAVDLIYRIKTDKSTRMSGDVLLKITDIDVLTKFLHDRVDDLIGKKTTSYDNYSGDIEWTSEEFDGARNLIRTLYMTSARSNAPFAIADDLAKNLPETVVDAIANCYEIRKRELVEFAIREQLRNAAETIPVVENIDWQLRWINGSSKLASISEPVARFDLHCFGGDSAKSRVNFEMKLEQLDKFINEVENVRSQLG